MKTIQMTLDEDLLKEIDKVVKKLGTNRSAFAREALQKAIKVVREREKEKKHREGYKKRPVKPTEFSDWEQEQEWGD